MVIIFEPKNTEIIKGKYSDTSGFEIHEGEISVSQETPLHNSMKVLLQQQSTRLQFVHSTLGSDSNIMIVYKKLTEHSLDFIIIQNLIFKSRPAYDHITQNLQINVADNENEIFSDPLKFLIAVEKEFLEVEPDDYLDYMPLLVNFLLEVVLIEIQEHDSQTIKNSIKNNPDTIYSNLLQIFLEENAWNKNKILELTESFGLCFNQDKEEVDKDSLKNECLRLYFNILILAMKLNENTVFKVIFLNYLDKRIDYVGDVFDSFTCMNAASWFLVDDVKEAVRYIQRVQGNIEKYLSTKSQINYLRLRGAIFEKIGKYSESMNEYLSSVSFLDSLENLTSSAGLAYAGIGNIHSLTGQHTKAIAAYSFAASIFDYFSLVKYKTSMLNNILTVRTIKAKDYLSAGKISLNNERFNEANEYIEKAVQEFALLISDTPKNQLVDGVKEVVSLLNPLVLRKGVEKNLETMITQSLSDVKALLDVCRQLSDGKARDKMMLEKLRLLATPRKLKVYQVILIYHDGRYITSLSSEDKQVEKDSNLIFAGAMTAIQLLFKEVIQSEKIHTIDAGENQILLRKDNLIQIVIIANKISEEIIAAVDELIDNIQKEYGEILNNWDGSLEKLQSTSSLMKEFIYDRINE